MSFYLVQPWGRDRYRSPSQRPDPACVANCSTRRRTFDNPRNIAASSCLTSGLRRPPQKTSHAGSSCSQPITVYLSAYVRPQAEQVFDCGCVASTSATLTGGSTSTSRQQNRVRASSPRQTGQPSRTNAPVNFSTRARSSTVVST